MNIIKKVIVLILALLLVACHDSSNLGQGQEVSLSVLSREALLDNQKTITLTQKEVLDLEYRQTKYLEGYDQIHERLFNECFVFMDKVLSDFLEVDYMYGLELELTNYGYDQVEKNNYSLMYVSQHYPEWISKLELEVVVYVDGFEENKGDSDKLSDINRVVWRYDEYDLGILSIISPNFGMIIFTPTMVDSVYQQDISNGYQYNFRDYYKQLVVESERNIYWLWIDNEIIHLNEKYGEKFGYYYNPYSDASNDHTVLYFPYSDMNLLFEAQSFKDRYVAAIYNNLLKEHIDGILEKYDFKDQIAYLIYCSSDDRQIYDMDKIIGVENPLNDIQDTIYVTFYVTATEEEIANEQLHKDLMEMNSEIYEPIQHGKGFMSMIYIYEGSESDILIAQKISEGLELSELYVSNGLGMENWADQWERRRNGHTFFSYLDNFLVYKYHYGFSDGGSIDRDIEWIENRRRYDEVE